MKPLTRRLTQRVCALALMASCAHAWASAQTPAPEQTFRGVIGNDGDTHLEVRARLRREGDTLTGAYFYERVKKEIALRGRVDASGGFTLEEFDPEGRQTGVFRGRLGEADTGAAELTGEWSRPDGSRKLSFRLREVPVVFTGGLRLVSRELKEQKARPKYEVAVEYPQLEGAAATAPAATGFNRAALAWATKAVEEFKRDGLEDDDDAPGASVGSYFSASYDVGVATDELVAVQFQVTNYYAGAAHPNHRTEVINYDLRRNRRLRLADLFKPSAPYLAALSDYCVRDLKRQARAESPEEPFLLDEEIENGAGPKEENYGSWLVTRRGFQITFDPYQVGPYAAGPQRVLVPYAALREHLNTTGPLAPLLK